jgi:type I restriction enzyme M protein
MNDWRIIEMSEKNGVSIGFEKQIWDAACVLWGHIPAAEYRKVIIGLIFLRYISNAFERRYNELVEEGDGFEDDRDAYTMENVFFVPNEARWNTIASAAHTAEIGTVIDNAMRAIEKENVSLKNVLPKNYASPDLDKRVLGDVVDLFTNMNMGDTEESKDLLGRTYEYCIAQFAAYEGVKGGEFYTPSSIVKTIVAVLKPFNNCRVYDPCCGSGGMFVQSAKFIQAHSGNRGSISVYGQESNADTWKMAKMNMAIRGIDADLGAYQADTFFNDLQPTLKADFIMANPPFNLSNWGQEKLIEDVRWKYGLPPATNANYAWIQHMIHHLAPNGKLGLVLAKGALSTETGGEDVIRKNLIESDLVEAIISIPTQMFYSTQIPVALWFISKNKKNKGKTVFIDARKLGHMVDRTHREFSDDDISLISEMITKYQNDTLADEKGLCAVESIQQIKNNNYILNPVRYVGVSDEMEEEDIAEKAERLISELSDLFEEEKNLEADITGKFADVDFSSRDETASTWEKSSLTKIANYLNGLAMQKYRPKDNEEGLPVMKIKELRQGFCDQDSEMCTPNLKDGYIVEDGDVIFSWSGSLLVDIWSGGKCGLNQHLFKVTSDDYDRWFYYAWTLYHLKHFAAIAADKATTMGHIKREDLSNAEVIVPPTDKYKKMGDLIEPLLELLVKKRIELKKLEELTNDILPKIISGEATIDKEK